MPYKDKEKLKAYQKAYQKAYRKKHKRDRKAYLKAYRKKHKRDRKAYLKAYRKKHKSYHNTKQKVDTNSLGKTKGSIRCRSARYLFNKLKHTKLKGYEIHHCFSYDTYKSFIYIPKELHLQIHQYLRDNEINAGSNHFSQIVHLINAWEGYTYIKV